MLLSYIVSFASLIASVWVLIVHYQRNPEIVGSAAMGVAGIVQCVLIVISGLVFWLARPAPDSYY